MPVRAKPLNPHGKAWVPIVALSLLRLREAGLMQGRQRRAGLLVEHGLSVEQYDELFRRQSGKCAICGTVDPGKGRYLHVDHCHTTHEIRGLLCSRCNVGLGMFADDAERLRAATSYMESSHTGFISQTRRTAESVARMAANAMRKRRQK